jgi:hypothetical protein
MGRAFDATGSYEVLLVRLAIVTLTIASLMLALPPYKSARERAGATEGAPSWCDTDS